MKPAFRKARYRCHNPYGCPYELGPDNPLTRHHIVPRKICGHDKARNIVVLCWRCHEQRESEFWRKMRQDKEFRRNIDRNYPGWWERYRK